jgi:hypothetical protein
MICPLRKNREIMVGKNESTGKYNVPKKHIHILNTYNSHANKDGILYFTWVGAECS